MGQLFFAGNGLIELGYASLPGMTADPSKGWMSTGYLKEPAVITTKAPRTGAVCALRTNVPEYGSVYLSKLQLGDRLIYEAVPPDEYVGFGGVDLAHPTREYRKVPTFKVEEGQGISAHLAFTGHVFQHHVMGYLFAVSLEWLYAEDF